MNKKIAIIIGAGPAGLTAAYEILKQTDVTPIVFEQTGEIGGISKTVNYKGNRIDIGGHRFFSKSDRIMNWWTNIMPIESTASDNMDNHYQGKKRQLTTDVNNLSPDTTNISLLIRNRISRIFFLRTLFDYPLSFSPHTAIILGPIRIIKIAFGYTRAIIFPIKDEKTLDDFLINRFGKELYLTFFKDYTEKVWGVRCDQISAEWGAQRIKGLSITKTIIHAIKQMFSFNNDSISQTNTETSLIQRFLYPKYGPGQMWEQVAHIVQNNGGKILMHKDVVGINLSGGNISSVDVLDTESGATENYTANYVLSSMPVKDLIQTMGETAPSQVRKTASQLQYRDFITVGLLLDKLLITDKDGSNLPDNWIYIQEPDVKVGRLQIFNNWSPYMVANTENIWIGLEYFCNEGDDLWSLSDDKLKELAIKEMVNLGFIDKLSVLDATVIRMPKAYPGYFGDAYANFSVIQNFTDSISNLFLIGRNGMHKYNNQDHSMLTAMAAVNNIANNINDKQNIWNINTESDYHENKD